MVEEDTNGIRALYRPKDYYVIARRRDKWRKNWSNRGGCIVKIAPIYLLGGPVLQVLKIYLPNPIYLYIHEKTTACKILSYFDNF